MRLSPVLDRVSGVAVRRMGLCVVRELGAGIIKL